jgi:hypothetical protein
LAAKDGDGLGSPGDGEVVDAGLVEDGADEADERVGDGSEGGLRGGIPGDGVVERDGTHPHTCQTRGATLGPQVMR